jgi:hypothetical protein
MNFATRLRVTTGTACVILLTACGSALASNDSMNDRISQALQGDWGQIKANLRYRFEHVKQKGLKTANGDPVRLRIGYLTPKFFGFQGYGEFLGNTSVFVDDYNNSSNGKTEYAVIGDPNKEALNQVWLAYEALSDTVIKGGRQKIAWDNERFICPASWRQMEQTFDSVTLLNSSLGDFSVKAAYLWNALTTANQDVNMNTPLLNLKYSFPDIGSLVAYGYWLDYDDPDDSGPFEYAYSSQTYGVRFDGSAAMGEDFKLLYTAEYASQSDYQDNPKVFTTDYYSVIGGLFVAGSDHLLKNISGKIGYDVFGSDAGVSFQTPLGANHRYNGWADIFGKTKPATGLRDLYASLSGTISGVEVDLVYHDFEADAGGSDYGSEFDIKVARKFCKHYTVLTSYSTYNADEYKGNTRKFWLELTVDF